MNCPSCNNKAKVQHTLKVSRWRNYKCPRCCTESTKTWHNTLLVYIVATGVGYSFYLMIMKFGGTPSIFLFALAPLFALYPIEALLGRLVPIENT
jgi:hypothetical protein